MQLLTSFVWYSVLLIKQGYLDTLSDSDSQMSDCVDLLLLFCSTFSIIADFVDVEQSLNVK